MAISLNAVNSEVVRAHKRIDDLTLSGTKFRILQGYYRNYTTNKSIKIDKKFPKYVILSGNGPAYGPEVFDYLSTWITSNRYIHESTLYYDGSDSNFTYHHVTSGGNANDNWFMIFQWID